MDKKFKCVLIALIISPLILSVVTIGIGEFPKEVAPKNELTFMTYNIHFGQGIDDLLNLERIAQNILLAGKKINDELLLLQSNQQSPRVGKCYSE